MSARWIYTITPTLMLAYLLKLSSYLLNDESVPLSERDYIFDILAVSEFLFYLGVFCLARLLHYKMKVHKVATVSLMAICRLYFASVAFATIEEFSTDMYVFKSATAYLFFILLIIGVGAYSIIQIALCQKRTQK